MSTLTQPQSLRLDLPLEAIADFCRRWKIAKLEVFGSALRDEFGTQSDVDFLYTFTDDARWGWHFVRAYDELEQILRRRVDLVSRQAVELSRNPYRKRGILESACVVYEA